MAESEWHPLRKGLRYVVQQLLWADAFGSAYCFARIDGRVQRFWTKRAAQKYADILNSEATK